MNITKNLYEIIAAYLEESDQHFQTQDENSLIFAEILGVDGTWTAIIQITDDDEIRRVAIHAHLPPLIPECNRLKVAELITRINYDLAVCDFEMGMDNGDVLLKSLLDLADGQLTNAMFERMYELSILTMNKYYAKILSAGFGELEPEIKAAEQDQPDGVMIQ